MRDSQGFPVYRNPGGEEVIPFWSSRTRVLSIQKQVPKYAQFEPQGIDWGDFVRDWVPDLIKGGMRIGLNWSGARALGYDRDPGGVAESVEMAIISRNPNGS
jgi:hypothetical protein